MDNRIIRSSVYAATLALLVGSVFNNFGGWQSLFKIASNFIGVWVLAVVFTTILAFIYRSWFANFLPGSVLLRGALFGSLVWIGFLILGGLLPYFKENVYQINLGNGLFISLVLHWIWGGALSTFLESKV